MSSFIDVRRTVVGLLKNHLEVEVRLEGQTQKVAQFPYVYYSVTTPYIPPDNRGVTKLKVVGESIKNKRGEQAMCTFSFTCCSENEQQAYDLCERAIEFFRHVGYRELSDNGIVFVGILNTRDMSGLIVDDRISRWACDVKLRYLKEFTRFDPTIQKFSIEEK